MELDTHLKNQIIDIETAKRFKALGLIQVSLFYYVNYWRGPTGLDIEDGQHLVTCHEKHITRIAGRKRLTEVEFVSAYTLAEVNAFLNTLKKATHIGTASARLLLNISPTLNRHLKTQTELEHKIEVCNRMYKRNFNIEDGQPEI